MAAALLGRQRPSLESPCAPFALQGVVWNQCNNLSSPERPDLTLPLAHPITITRGPASHLVTLMDAAILIRGLEPWRQARPVWDRAAGLILLAAETRKRDDIAEATRQLLVCVERENWWKANERDLITLT